MSVDVAVVLFFPGDWTESRCEQVRDAVRREVVNRGVGARFVPSRIEAGAPLTFETLDLVRAQATVGAVSLALLRHGFVISTAAQRGTLVVRERPSFSQQWSSDSPCAEVAIFQPLGQR